MSTIISFPGKLSNTITNWFNVCCEVCSVIILYQTRHQMIGRQENPIHIDEAWIAGCHKYNRCRMLTSDQLPSSEDLDAEIIRKNHGARKDGPWKFCLKK